jgi:hypothetical protein
MLAAARTVHRKNGVPGVKAAAGIGLVMRLPLIKILEAFKAPNYGVLHRGRDVVVAHSVGKADRDRGCW